MNRPSKQPASTRDKFELNVSLRISTMSFTCKNSQASCILKFITFE